MDYTRTTHELPLNPYQLLLAGCQWAFNGLPMGYPWAAHGLLMEHH